MFDEFRVCYSSNFCSVRTPTLHTLEQAAFSRFLSFSVCSLDAGLQHVLKGLGIQLIPCLELSCNLADVNGVKFYTSLSCLILSFVTLCCF